METTDRAAWNLYWSNMPLGCPGRIHEPKSTWGVTAREFVASVATSASYGSFQGQAALAGPAELLFRAKAGMVKVPR